MDQNIQKIKQKSARDNDFQKLKIKNGFKPNFIVGGVLDYKSETTI